MRDGKFRGKRLDNRKWEYGDLIENQGRFFIYHATSETTIEDNDDGRIVVAAVEVDPNTVGQYTGLQDMNGKDIWKDDIMCIPETDFNAEIVGRVLYEDGSYYIIPLTGAVFGGCTGHFGSMMQSSSAIFTTIRNYLKLNNHAEDNV